MNHRNPEALFSQMKETVDGLLETRLKVRKLWQDLSALKNDASGVAFNNNYQDKEIDTVHNQLYSLDRLIGEDFRAIERLQSSLEKKQVK